MLRELKTFLAVAEHGSFAAAAARTGLTQSAVSAQMKRLESELNLVLFERTARSASLSAVGRETLQTAGELMALYARLGRHDDTRQAGGLLRIGAIASAQTSFLIDALVAFHRALPECRVRWVPGVSLNLLGQVDSGELDAAVIIRPPFAVPSDLHWRTLAREPFVLLAPKALAKHGWPSLLKTQPFIRYDKTSFGGRAVERFLRRARITVHEVAELDELEGIALLVARGLGVALLPQVVGRDRWPQGTVALDLGEQVFYREIGMVERPEHARGAAAQHFADAIAAAAHQYTSRK